MTISVETFPDRLAWLTARRHGLGGSDAVVVSGHEGYTSNYSLWSDKCGLVPLDADDVPEYMEAGNFMEPGIIKWWERRTGFTATPTPLTIFRNSKFPWMFASTDALVGDDAGLDAKNTDRSKAQDWDEGVPLKHQVQAQHYLAITERERWHFAAAIGGNKLVTATVNRNERFIEQLVAAELAWWERHIVGREPPEPDDSDSTERTVKAMFPRAVPGKVAPLSAEALEIRDCLLAAETEHGILEKEIKGFKSKLRAMIGDADEGALPDGSRYTLKEQSRAECVVKASTFRVLRYHERKEKA